MFIFRRKTQFPEWGICFETKCSGFERMKQPLQTDIVQVQKLRSWLVRTSLRCHDSLSTKCASLCGLLVGNVPLWKSYLMPSPLCNLWENITEFQAVISYSCSGGLDPHSPYFLNLEKARVVPCRPTCRLHYGYTCPHPHFSIWTAFV
jgi:hypothetical protein